VYLGWHTKLAKGPASARQQHRQLAQGLSPHLWGSMTDPSRPRLFRCKYPAAPVSMHEVWCICWQSLLYRNICTQVLVQARKDSAATQAATAVQGINGAHACGFLNASGEGAKRDCHDSALHSCTVCSPALPRESLRHAPTGSKPITCMHAASALSSLRRLSCYQVTERG
jgi:hypothetical protein